MQSACKLCLFNFFLPLKSKNCIVEGLKQLSPESSDAIQIFPFSPSQKRLIIRLLK